MPDWVTEVGLPCFRPHVRKDLYGNVKYEVTAADIDEIVKNSSDLTVHLHGNKPPITEGHRDFSPSAKEKDQPLILGHMDNFTKGALPDGTPAVLCDRHYMPQHAERAKRHPFPSVDYLPKSKKIVGLAKLTKPPELNVGAAYYPGTTEPVYVYSMEAAPTPEYTPEEMEGCEKVFKYLTQKYGSWPSANNTYVPSELDDDKKKGKEMPESNQAANAELIEKYEAAQAELVQKYEATNKLLETAQAQLKGNQDQISKLIQEREGDKVDRILDNLEKVERYQFDRPAEREVMLAMTEAERVKRAESIRKYHHKLPGGDRIEVYEGNAEGPVQETSRDLSNKAVRMASAEGISYDAALAKIKGGK